MYKITYIHNGETVENPLYTPGDSDYCLTACKLSLGMGKAGELTISIPVVNPAKDNIICLTDEIIFYRNGVELFRGRAITAQQNFTRTGTLECEGILAYLYDTWYPPYDFSGSPDDLIRDVLATHNAKVDERKRLYVGNITVTDSNDYITRSCQEYSRSLDVLTEKLVNESLGGYLRVRYENGKRYLDYLDSYGSTASQPVDFGYNLLDIATDIQYGDVVTAILPLGAAVETEDGETGSRLTVESVNGGNLYVSDSEAVAKYGWIEDCVTWDDVTIADNLLKKAQAYLSTVTSPIRTITVNAVDMAQLDSSVTSIFLGDAVHISSPPHDIDMTSELTELAIDPLDEAQNTLTFGTTESLTDIINRNQSNALTLVSKERIDRRTAYERLQQAISEGNGLYITPVEMADGSSVYYLHDKPSLDDSTYVVQVNSQSIAFSTDGGQTYPFGYTVDGALVMDIIQSNGINAEWVKIGSESITKVFDSVESDGVKDIVSYYALGTSSTTPPSAPGVDVNTEELEVDGEIYCVATGTGGSEPFLLLAATWVPEQPTAADGEYVWLSYRVEYLDGTIKWTEPVLLTDGYTRSKVTTLETDFSVVQGKIESRVWQTDITDAVSSLQSKEMTPYYALGTSSTTPPSAPGVDVNTEELEVDGGKYYVITSSGGSEPFLLLAATWVTAQPTAEDGEYVWLSYRVEYLDGAIKWTEPVLLTDGYTRSEVKTVESKIEQLADSITLSVSGELGGTATIELVVGDEKQTGTLDMSDIRQKFAEDTSSVTVSGGTVTFESGKLLINSGNFTLDEKGTMSATNGSFSGTITANSGTIGKINISSSADKTVHYATNSLYTQAINTEIKAFDPTSNDDSYVSVNVDAEIGMKPISSITDQFLYARVKKTGDRWKSSADGLASPLVFGVTGYGNLRCSGITIYPNRPLQYYDDELSLIEDGLIVAKTDDDYLWLNNVKFGTQAVASDIDPSRPNEKDLGGSDYYWRRIYVGTIYRKSESTLSTSDRKRKENFQPLDDTSKAFLMSLNPTTYTFKDGTGRRHMGFVAQDVADAAKHTVGDIAVFAAHRNDIEDDTENRAFEEIDDEKLDWYLDYQELIAPMVSVIQEQERRIEKLERMLEKYGLYE